MANFPSTAIVPFALLIILLHGFSNAQLSPDYYSYSCPILLPTVRSVVLSAIAKEPRIGASLLRLFFHDCFVNGCDASILLDDTPTFIGEKTAKANNNSARGFEVIDQIKSAVEQVCPAVVSCADILAISARDSVVLLGGPNWEVKLGRRDSKTASRAAVKKFIPAPSFSLGNLISNFSVHGFSTKDLVALTGAHTIGLARCANFRSHIYNDSNIDATLSTARKTICPRKSGSGDNNLAPLDPETTMLFDNYFFKNILISKGLLHSDMELLNTTYTASLVKIYSRDSVAFFGDFVAGMIKMGDVRPLTGSKGEIRLNCRKKN
ncbi:peroxidase P7-like [Carex rostrata]